MHYRHLFFDMDGTVTPSRSKVRPEMKGLLSSLSQSVAIISGSHNDQIDFQMDVLPVIRMGQNGNHVIHPQLGELWFDTLTDEEKKEIMRHVDAIWRLCEHDVPDQNDIIEDRGSQISLSIYGHHADPAAKKAYDGDFAKRKALLSQIPFESRHVEVKLGGSTCLDYFRKGRDKGYNIDRLIERMGWLKEECVFFGDALFPGGNDEAVIGVIDTIPVADHLDTYEKLRKMFGV